MLRNIRLVLWGLIAVSALIFGVVWFAGSSLDLPDVRRLPLAATIGGPFELTAQDGSRFSSARLAGKPYALFFGFTQCPDVCPTTLLEMSNNLRQLGEKAAGLKVLFISVDPERDTVDHMKAYLTNFDDRIVGLTGTPAEIAAVAKAYRAIYEKVPTSGGYTLNHTASIYLMNSAGRLVSTISYQEPEKTQIEKLRRLVAE